MIGQHPNKHIDPSQRHHCPPRKTLHATCFKPRPGSQRRQQKPQRAPQPHTRIAIGIKAALGADPMHQNCFAQRHHGASVNEHEQQHTRQHPQTARHQQTHRAKPSRNSAKTHQANALSGVVTQPTPSIRSHQARGRLNRSQHANRGHRQALAFEPQRQVGIEKPHVRQITRRQSGKRQQGFA